MYIPLLDTLEENDYSEGLNDKTTTTTRNKLRNKEYNHTASRWAAQMSQAGSDVIGRVNNDLESFSMTPGLLHHGLKTIGVRDTSKMQNMRREVKTEESANDTWVNN